MLKNFKYTAHMKGYMWRRSPDAEVIYLPLEISVASVNNPEEVNTVFKGPIDVASYTEGEGVLEAIGRSPIGDPNRCRPADWTRGLQWARFPKVVQDLFASMSPAPGHLYIGVYGQEQVKFFEACGLQNVIDLKAHMLVDHRRLNADMVLKNIEQLDEDNAHNHHHPKEDDGSCCSTRMAWILACLVTRGILLEI